MNNDSFAFDSYSHSDWCVYAGGGAWAPLGFSFWATFFTQRPFGYEIDYFATQSIMIWDGSIATSYIRSSEIERFGNIVAARIVNDSEYVDTLCQGFRSAVDKVLSTYEKAKTNTISLEEYMSYQEFFLANYYPHHIQVKVVVDYLPAELLDKYLSVLESARLYAEPVFSEEPLFVKNIAEQHIVRSQRTSSQILGCMNKEFLLYWRDGVALPPGEELDARYDKSAVFFEQGNIQHIVTGASVDEVKIFLNKDRGAEMVKGVIAYAGTAEGVARIIIDPSEVDLFNDGDILIAPATRPEYLHLMKRAGAFVTNSGGVLSHAAIVARELGKPCIIGTGNATECFMDGDFIEVDADTGIVKKI